MTVQELAQMSTGRFYSGENTSDYKQDNMKTVTVEELASKSTGRFLPYKTFDFNGYLNKVTSFDTNLTNYYNQNGTKYNFDFDRFDIDAMKKETQTAIGFVNYNKANLQNADELLDYLNNVNTYLNSWNTSFGEMKSIRAEFDDETAWNTAVRAETVDKEYQGIDALNDAVLGISAGWNPYDYTSYETSNKNEDGTYKTDELYGSWSRQATSKQDVQRAINVIDKEIEDLNKALQYSVLCEYAIATVNRDTDEKSKIQSLYPEVRNYNIEQWMKLEFGINAEKLLEGELDEEKVLKSEEARKKLGDKIATEQIEKRIATLESTKDAIDKEGTANAYTKGITLKEDFEQHSKYSPVKKTDEELKELGYKQHASGEWYIIDGLGRRETYFGEDTCYAYINDPSIREIVDTQQKIIYEEETYKNNGYDTLTETEIGVYNYLHYQDRKNGTRTAENYLFMLSPLLEKRALQKDAELHAEFAREAPIPANIYSFYTNFKNAQMFPYKVALTALGDYDAGNNYLLDKYGNRTQAIRGATSENMPYIGKIVYNAGMSIGDMGIAMLAGGGDKILTQAIMSSSAGSSAITDAKNNGASDAKALVMGLGSAAIEWATEKYSIEAILSDPKGKLKYFLKNAITEGTEEGVANIGNTILDIVASDVLGETNEIEQRIAELVLDGNTEEEAFKIVVEEKLKSLRDDVITGMLAGGGMSQITSAPSYIDSFKQSAKIGTEGTQALVDEGVAIGNELAIETQQKGGNARMVRRAEILQENKRIRAEMYQAGQKGQNEVKTTTAEYLRRMGENGDVEALSTAVSNIVTGQGTEADISLVSQNQNAQTAVELLTNRKVKTEEKSVKANLTKIAAEKIVAAETKNVSKEIKVVGPRVNEEAGLVRDEYTQTLDAKEMDKLDAVAKAFGVKVVFKDKVNMGKDDAAIQGSVVEIEKGTDRALEYLIGHEIMHRIRELSPSSYKSFANAVKVSRYSEYAAELETTERVYEEGEDYDEEAICNMAGKIALDSKLLEKFIEQNKHDKNILQALLDVFKKIWNTVTKAEQRKINDAIYQLEKALNEGSKVAERLAKEGKTETRDSIDYEAQKNNTDAGVKHMFKGITSDGTEVYKTSDVVMNMSKSNRIKRFKKIFELNFQGRRAKFERNGHTYYARFDNSNEGLGKFVYRDFNSDKKGLKAKIRLLAEGDIFEIVEDSTYRNSAKEQGKQTKAHKNVKFWDYYWKSIFVDGKGYDILINVRLKVPGNDFSKKVEYVYSIAFNENGKVAPPDSQLLNSSASKKRAKPLILDNIEPQSKPVVKKNSMQNNRENSSPTIKGSRKGGDNFATERKQSKDRQVVFNELAQEQANEIEAKLKEALGENVDLRKQLKEANRRAEHFKSQLHRTPELAPDMKALKARAKEYLADYKGSELDVNVLASRMSDWRLEMYDIVLNSESEQERENRWEALREKIGVTCGEILSNSYYRNEEADTDYKIIADYVGPKSGVTIRITEELKAEIEYSFGSYLDFRKRFSKHVKFKLNDGTDVSSVYAELAQNVPEYFNESTTTAPSDQLIQICEVLESLHNVYYSAVPNNSTLEVAIDAQADMIIGTLLDAPNAKPTFADKQNARLQTMHAEAVKAKNDALKAERAEKQRAVEEIKEYYRQRDNALRNSKNERDAKQALLNNARILERMFKRSTRARRAEIEAIIGNLDLASVSISKKKITEFDTVADLAEELGVGLSQFDDSIQNTMNRLKLKQIGDMNNVEVQQLNNSVLALIHAIRTENKMVDSKDRREIRIQGMESLNNIRAAQKETKNKYEATEKTLLEKAGEVIGRGIDYHLDLIRWVRKLTGYVDNDPLYIAFQALNDGQRKMLLYQQQAEEMFRNFMSDKKFMKHLESTVEIKGFDVNTGETTTVKITPAMRIALYMHSRNKQNMRHIEGGGVFIANAKMVKKDGYIKSSFGENGIRLTEDNVREICFDMTDKERAFAAALERYFDGFAKNAINDVSEKLVGYPKALVSNYFPINSNPDFVMKDRSGLVKDGTLEGMGSLKERENSENPIYLFDAVTILQRHINEGSKYVGMAVPISNINKLLSVKNGGYNVDGIYEYDSDGIWHAMNEKQQKYVENLLRDLQNPKNDDKWITNLLSKSASATLVLNAGVAVKQAASFPTAAAEIGWKPLLKTMASAPIIRDILRMKNIPDNSIEVVNENTPLFWYRAKGFNGIDNASVTMNPSKMPTVLNWIQGMDLLTTKALYKSCQYYVRDTMHLEPGTKEYNDAVAEKYANVIERTQPNYTIMQRNGMLRGNIFVRTVFRYMTQPYQNFGILADCVGNMNAKYKQMKVNPTAETKEAYAEAKRAFARGTSSLVVAQVVYTAMQTAWNLLRGKKDRYKDDEEEITFLSFMKGFGIDFGSAMANIIPFGSTVYEAVLALLGDGQFYGLSSAPVEIINDIINSAIRLSKAGEEQKIYKVREVIDKLAVLKGIPTKNIRSLLATIGYNSLRIIKNERIADYYLRLWDAAIYYKDKDGTYKATSDAYDMLFYAYVDKSKNGKEAYTAIRNHMIDNGVSEDKIDKAIKERVTKYPAGVKTITSNVDKAIDAVEDMSYYKNMTDKQKASYEDRATTYYKELLKKEYGVDSNIDEEKPLRIANGLAEKGHNPYKYWLYMATRDLNGNGSVDSDEKEKTFKALGITGAYKNLIQEIENEKNKKK